MDRLLLLIAVAALAGALAAWWRARDGLVRTTTAPGADLARIAGARGRPAIVELTAPGCASCHAAHAVIEQVAAARRDVVVAQADVTDHPEVARAHGVLRAPTTFVLAEDATILGRVSGVPRREDLEALLGHVGQPSAAGQ